MVTAMIPAPGESPGDWWVNTGFMEARAAEIERLGGDDSEETTFTHDLPPALAVEAGEHIRDQSGTPMEKPFPLAAMPDVPTEFLVCTDDRFFPPDFMRRVVRERLGITDPGEIAAGHLPMLSRPVELVDWIEAVSAPRRIPAAVRAEICSPATDPTLAAVCGGLAVVGHNWSPFLRGAGGAASRPRSARCSCMAWPGARGAPRRARARAARARDRARRRSSREVAARRRCCDHVRTGGRARRRVRRRCRCS